MFGTLSELTKAVFKSFGILLEFRMIGGSINSPSFGK
jgi:hypothetical protein